MVGTIRTRAIRCLYIMDRALQYEMDRGERLDKTLMAEIRRLIRQWSPNEIILLILLNCRKS